MDDHHFGYNTKLTPKKTLLWNWGGGVGSANALTHSLFRPTYYYNHFTATTLY
jgi:hypothetical protein